MLVVLCPCLCMRLALSLSDWLHTQTDILTNKKTGRQARKKAGRQMHPSRATQDCTRNKLTNGSEIRSDRVNGVEWWRGEAAVKRLLDSQDNISDATPSILCAHYGRIKWYWASLSISYLIWFNLIWFVYISSCKFMYSLLILLSSPLSLPLPSLLISSLIFPTNHSMNPDSWRFCFRMMSLHAPNTTRTLRVSVAHVTCRYTTNTHTHTQARQESGSRCKISRDSK